MAVAVMVMTARDRLYINDFSINPGQSKTIEVLLDNDTAYCGLQTDIVLPEGLTIEQEDEDYTIDLTSRKGRGHVVSTNKLANGAIRVFVSSQNSHVFSGNSGAILTISLKADKSFKKGNIILRNSVLVEENVESHLLDDAIARVNGGEPLKITVYVNIDAVADVWTSGMNYHSWGGDGSHSTTWPGVKVETNQTFGGKSWYYRSYTINSNNDYINFTFSTGNGNSRTVELNNVKTDKCYEISSTKSGSYYMVNDVTADYSGIESVSVDKAIIGPVAVYNIDGCYIGVFVNVKSALSSLEKGLYIIGNKKYIVE